MTNRWRETLIRVLSLAPAAASLLLCLAVLALWVRGLVVADIVHRITHHQRAAESGSDSLRVTSGRGVFALTFMKFREPVTYPRVFVDRERREYVQTQPLPNRSWTTWSHSTMAPDRLNLVQRNIWARFGFTWRSATHRTPAGGVRTERSFRAPYWAVAAALAILPLLTLRRLTLRRRRQRNGLCPACGYDLRASPGRCTECGWKGDGQ